MCRVAQMGYRLVSLTSATVVKVLYNEAIGVSRYFLRSCLEEATANATLGFSIGMLSQETFQNLKTGSDAYLFLIVGTVCPRGTTGYRKN